MALVAGLAAQGGEADIHDPSGGSAQMGTNEHGGVQTCRLSSVEVLSAGSARSDGQPSPCQQTAGVGIVQSADPAIGFARARTRHAWDRMIRASGMLP